MKKIGIFLIGLLVVVGLWLASGYNRLISQSQAVQSQWAQVESQYQRRYDLIPNLVEATQSVLEQEQEVFGQIAEARQGYAGAQTLEGRVQAANQLESALGRLLAIVENYPELRSSETVQDLMTELAGTENRISVERQRYNETVRSYNTLVMSFPTNIISNIFGFNQEAYFEAVETAEIAPEVDLDVREQE